MSPPLVAVDEPGGWAPCCLWWCHETTTCVLEPMAPCFCVPRAVQLICVAIEGLERPNNIATLLCAWDVCSCLERHAVIVLTRTAFAPHLGNCLPNCMPCRATQLIPLAATCQPGMHGGVLRAPGICSISVMEPSNVSNWLAVCMCLRK
jgi:hypothetical protein